MVSVKADRNESLTRGRTLLEAAQGLSPAIVAAAADIEREQRWPVALIEAFAEADLFRMLVPRALGGSEVSLAIYADIIEALAKADGSVAWCLAQAVTCSLMAAFLPDEAAMEIFGCPTAVVASGPGTPGVAVPVEGGYRLTGRWSYASGCHHATWFAGGATVVGEDGNQQLTEGGLPIPLMTFFPVSDAAIIPAWQVSGLRGTGSDDYTVENLFVPLHRCVTYPLRQPYQSGPLYDSAAGASVVGFQGFQTAFTVGFASVALGLARATLDAFLEFAVTKQLSRAEGLLCEQPLVQWQIGHAEAMLRSSRGFLQQTISEVWEDILQLGTFAPNGRALLRLAATHAIHESVRVVDAVHQAAGAAAIFTSNPFERRFRDIHAVTQQAQGRIEHYQTVGKFYLGIPAEYPIL
jgi:alkylation response protein AidB-like acyl-CoA dehydrogenase